MKEILGFEVDEVAAALWISRTLEALIRQRKLNYNPSNIFARTRLV